jgi:transposase
MGSRRKKKMTTQPRIVGIDLGKHWFHVMGVDGDGAMMLRKKRNRAQLKVFAATFPRSRAMEACCGSQYWGRVFAHAGHEVRIVPAQFVKPYVKTNKNDFNDAAAIAEAASRASMRFVPLKTTKQLELQTSHRINHAPAADRKPVGPCGTFGASPVSSIGPLTEFRRSRLSGQLVR